LIILSKDYQIHTMTGNSEELLDMLIDGARYGDLEDVENALSQGVDVNAQDEFGRTGMFFSYCL